MKPRIPLLLAVMAALSPIPAVLAQTTPQARPTPEPGLSLDLWAREPMVQDPVAIQFDDQGVLYVAETARRGTVDIDIRAHRDWLVEDLANQSVGDLRAFFRRRMDPEFSVGNAGWLKDYTGDGIHDWRDLTTIRERIRRLEDTHSKGVADRSQIFTEGFNEEISGVVAGAMPVGDSVLVTGYPELQRFQDTNRDGIADRQETLFRGFGVHAAFDGHDLHGLTQGPDGRIYFSNGDNGFNVTNKEGRVLSYPNTGGVLRMQPDGTQLEVFATGLRNVQEIAFDDFGNLFAVDNDGDLRDERERFVYIAEESDSGWRLHWQFRDRGWTSVTGQPEYNPWMDERMSVPQHPGQPAHITPPLSNYSVGPGSIRYNPGTALSEKYRNHFFLIQFPVQKVTTFQAKPKGAYFEMADERTVLSGMMASSLDFGPDGALYVGDWDGMWNPDSKGAIWKLDDPTARGSAKRLEVQTWLKKGVSGVADAELLTRLGHEDSRIRVRSQLECVKRGLKDALLKTANDATLPEIARIHALWGLGQLGDPTVGPLLPLETRLTELRAQAAKIAGELQSHAVFERLAARAHDAEPRVRYHALMALGKLGNPRALHHFVSNLELNGEQDAFIRHAAIVGLARVGTADSLGALRSHRDKFVRIGAVVALRRLHSPAVAVFLSDTEPQVSREAARAIHDDHSIPAALPALAALASKAAAMSDEPVARRVLSANFRVATLDTANRLLAAARDASLAEPLRVEAIECLSQWGSTQHLDRVEGMIRRRVVADPAAGRTLLVAHLDTLLAGSPPALVKSLTRIVLAQKLPAKPEIFVRWASSTNEPASTRSRALEYLSAINAPSIAPLAGSMLPSPELEVRLSAWQVLARHSPNDFFRHLEAHRQNLALQERQQTLALLASTQSPSAEPLLLEPLNQLIAGTLTRDLELDVLESARRSTLPSVTQALSKIESARGTNSPLSRLRPALFGGNAARGRELFHTSVQAQCARCHDAGGEGSQAGPVLKGIGARVSREYLLEALVEPSAKIAEGYGLLNLTLKGGDSLDGILLKQTPTELTLRLVTGESRTIPRSQVDSQFSNAISAMPPMGEVLTPMELRDVIEFLATWR